MNMVRSTFKAMFYVNGRRRKNGIVSIIGRVTIYETVAQISCKWGVPKTLWGIKATKPKARARRHETLIWRWTTSRHKSSSISNAYPTVKHS